MAKKNTFDKFLNIQTIKKKNGACRIKLTLKDILLNYGGIAHGGVIASICDIVLAGAVESVLKKDQWCVTAELNVHFLNPAPPKSVLYGYAKIVKVGKTLAFVEGGIETIDKKQIAKATGIWAIKNLRVKT